MSAKRPGRSRLHRIAAAVLILGATVLLLSAALWAVRANNFRDVTNLRTLGIVFKMYANGDYWPRLSSEPGRLMFEIDTL